ncbi:MAG: hypothetical protein IJ809_00410 [Clostridia bacterium]|nr:hypothetical protein [Clostridia bacterium]
MKSYGLDYVAGTAARKLEYEYEEEVVEAKRTRKVEKTNAHVQMSTLTKAKYIVSVVVGFSMFLVITYRYSMISESNLKAIKLKSELETVTSDLSLAIMNVEQGANLNEIEAYAKQKLGMQKPDKNQIVYVDSSTEQAKNIVENENNTSSILDKIKEFLGIK